MVALWSPEIRNTNPENSTLFRPKRRASLPKRRASLRTNQIGRFVYYYGYGRPSFDIRHSRLGIVIRDSRPRFHHNSIDECRKHGELFHCFILIPCSASLRSSQTKTAFTRCRHILKTMKNVTAAKLELAFTRCRNNLKTVGNLPIKSSLQDFDAN